MEVKLLEYTEDDGFGASKLRLEISGKHAHCSVLNSIRKICMCEIPIYAFHPSNVIINKNTTVFDKIQLTTRLIQIPITNLAGNDVIFLPSKYYKDGNFSSPDFKHYVDDNQIIEYYVNQKNNGPDEIMYVTTNHLVIKINDVLIENSKHYSKKNPIVLCQLRLDEEIQFSLKANIAIGLYNTIFDASNVYYKEIVVGDKTKSKNSKTQNSKDNKDNEEDDSEKEIKYQLTIESMGQLDEFTILERGCLILAEKLRITGEKLLKQTYNSIVTQNNELVLEIIDEDMSCGSIINFHLQNHPNVIYSGCIPPTFLERKILIRVKTKNISPIDAIQDAIKDSINQINDFKNIVKNL